MNRIIPFVFLSLALCSCSLKEDRSKCPVSVEVLLDASSQKSIALSFWNDRKLVASDAVGGQTRGEHSIHYELQGEDLTLLACTDSLSEYINGGEFIIPAGLGMPELYAGCVPVDKDTVHVFLEKKYLSVIMSFSREDGIDSRGVVTLRGNVCGIDLFSGAPVIGPYSAILSPLGNMLSFRIPRQADSSLKIIFEDGGVIDLGAMLYSFDYDWDAGRFDDIYIDSDYILGEYRIQVGEWQADPGLNIVF